VLTQFSNIQTTKNHIILFALAAQVTEITEMLQVAPYFVRTLNRSAEATEGEHIRLTCQARGVPQPEVRWFKDQQPLQASQHVQMMTGADGVQELLLTKLERADVGIYTCEAKNVLGSSRTQTSLMSETFLNWDSHGNLNYFHRFYFLVWCVSHFFQIKCL